MAALKISDELAKRIKEEAEERGLSVEEYLRAFLLREQSKAARRKIEQEQEWWLSLPLNERAKYEGEHIAVYNKQLVDHGKDKAVLYGRIRKKYGSTPVLVMPASGPAEIRTFSPRIARQ